MNWKNFDSCLKLSNWRSWSNSKAAKMLQMQEKYRKEYTSDDIKKFVTEAREVVDSYLSADQTSMVPNYADLTELEKEYTSTGGSGGSDEEVSVPMC